MACKGDNDLPWCDGYWPENAVAIITEFDSRSHDAIYADAVAAHEARFFDAICVEEFRVEFLAVFVAEFEYLTHFDTTLKEQFLAVVCIAFYGVADIGYLHLVAFKREIAARYDTPDMVIGFVGSCDTCDHCSDVVIDQEHINLVDQTNRPGETRGRAGDVGYGRFFGKFSAGSAKDLCEFFRIYVVVASNECSDGFIRRRINKRLNQILWFSFQELADFFNGPDVRGVKLFGLAYFGACLRQGRRVNGSFFDVPCLVAAVYVDNNVFTVFAGNSELVRTGPAHFAGLCFDDDVFDSAALEYPAICIVHYAVGFFETFRAGVETVRIFHDKFARAEYAEPGAELITELKTHLVDIDGQLLVGIYLTSHEVCYDLFGGRSKDILAAVAVGKCAEGFAVVNVSTGLLP